MSQKGVSVYLSQADLEALGHADDHLYTALERASADLPELRLARDGIRSILDKAGKANQTIYRRSAVQRAMAQLPAPVSTVQASTMVAILEAKTVKGFGLWIDKDTDPRFSIFMLDCESDRSGFKRFDGLPRIYRTERGARQAAALLTEEKLTWAPVDQKPPAE
jgi:hypothetical protein